MKDVKNYINLKIDVEGKIHNVKVEKGVMFGGNAVQTDGSIFKLEQNDLSLEDYVNNNKIPDLGSDWYLSKSPTNNDSIKMSKGEFSIFQSVANNNLENGDEIVLSRKDLEDAVELYREGKFTDDIAKDLPEGYSTERGIQYLEGSEINAMVEDKNGQVHSLILNFLTNDYSETDWYFKPEIVSVGYSGENNVIMLDESFQVKKEEGGKIRFIGDCGTEVVKYTDKNGNKCADKYKDGSLLSSTQYNAKESKYIVKYEFGEETHYYTDKKKNENGIERETYYKDGSWFIEYTKDKAHETGIESESFYKNGKQRAVVYSYKQTEQTGIEREEYHENGQISHIEYSKDKAHETGVYDEYFDEKSNITRRDVWNEVGKAGISREYYDERGNVIKQSIEIENKYIDVDFTYDNNGNTKITALDGSLEFDENYNIVKFESDDVEAYFNEEKMSESVKSYKKEFEKLSEHQIAQKMSEQIQGWSTNDKTLDMFDAIPNSMLLDVLYEYSHINPDKSLLVAMAKELGMDIEKDIMPRCQRMLAVYALKREKVRTDFEFSKEDYPITYLSTAEAFATGRISEKKINSNYILDNLEVDLKLNLKNKLENVIDEIKNEF